MRLTVDANLFVARFREADAGHQDAVTFFGACEERRVQLVAPIILVCEVAGALARIRGEPRFGELAATRLLAQPRLRFRQIDSAYAERAARLAARRKLRGIDALYLALAQETKSTLITADEELLACLAAPRAMSPRKWLEEIGG